MKQEQFIELLDKHQLKKTEPRLKVLSILAKRKVATSQPELEQMLSTDVDRVTLYRILKTFEEKGILHRVLDLNGTANYAMCSSECDEHQHQDQHLHFNCTVCNNVYCLDDLHFPAVKMPKGFKMESISFVATGICNKCSKK